MISFENSAFSPSAPQGTATQLHVGTLLVLLPPLLSLQMQGCSLGQKQRDPNRLPFSQVTDLVSVQAIF